MKFFLKILIFCVCLPLFLSACASVSYPKEVLIPTKCDIPARARPIFDNSAIVDSVKNLLIYTETLESDLAFCRGEKTQEKAQK